MAKRTPMFRDSTYSDLSRSDVADEAATEFVVDEDAFRGFYERTARGVWAYLVRITGDRELADDLLQETFYRFLRAAASHESEAHRRNSLYVIAGNLARDARRRSLTHVPLISTDAGIDQIPSGTAAGKPEGMADLTRAMSSLKPRERAILWLAYAEGASHQEIAGALGIRPGSLKTLLFRARRKVAGLLGGKTDGGRA
jgi:RNA polymerase sigma-70 factor, ECF subfamily